MGMGDWDGSQRVLVGGAFEQGTPNAPVQRSFLPLTPLLHLQEEFAYVLHGLIQCSLFSCESNELFFYSSSLALIAVVLVRCQG